MTTNEGSKTLRGGVRLRASTLSPVEIVQVEVGGCKIGMSLGELLDQTDDASPPGGEPDALAKGAQTRGQRNLPVGQIRDPVEVVRRGIILEGSIPRSEEGGLAEAGPA